MFCTALNLLKVLVAGYSQLDCFDYGQDKGSATCLHK